ncbi:hypothetical protein [Streptomyces sp. NPDC048419]|uniref:hypothetical protein n=1 Tax=Streptomyces sp. NPDC048419 TaxID=3365547 RepID=UPI00371278DC
MAGDQFHNHPPEAGNSRGGRAKRACEYSAAGDSGYVIASMRQLADESHMKMTAAKSNKQKLVQRGLLTSSERFSPRNGARIADLYRVHLDLLAGMKRERSDYGPTLVEEVTFNIPQENRRDRIGARRGTQATSPRPPRPASCSPWPTTNCATARSAACPQDQA